jgi:M6 family metalloprotease-like protein
MKIKILFIAFFIPTLMYSAPWIGQVKSFKQPNGSTVDIKLFGTEYYIRAESIDGYTLIRDKNSGWICYADVSDNRSELISTGIIYTGKSDNPSTLKNNFSFQKHLDISDESKNSIIYKNQLKTGISIENKAVKTPWHAVSGHITGLCILVDFPDEPATLPLSEFDSFCNDLSYSNNGNNGSLRKFYSDISGGKVDYENVVYGYYHASQTFQYYEQLPIAQGAQEILGLALNWLDQQGFDFSTLSTNPDGSIMAINLMYTGNAQNWNQGMWWHMGSYTSFSADGVHSDSYNCSPANAPLELSVVCHENGHMIGKWPDTYKYNTNTGPDGIGAFDLMCNYGSSTNPVPPNPYFRSNAGWGRVVDVTNFNGLISDTANSLTCYKYYNLNDTNEFFIMENRTKTGRSLYIPDNGLTIWHINRMGENQTTNHEVYLVHANNDVTDHYHACFRWGYNTEYNHSTTPNSHFLNGDPSGLRVWNIGAMGNIITYKLGTGSPAPILHLTYLNITNDNNGNGFLESGETANFNLNAENNGQLSSGNVTATISAIGINAGYVTVNTSTIPVGIINNLTYIPISHSISITANTPSGTIISLRFEISDGTFSTFITKDFLIGKYILNNNNTYTICSSLYYDNGGYSNNYSNSSDFIQTLYPISSIHPLSINFLTFELEDEINCGYDYLNIFDGSSTSSPLLGIWCGNNSPGIITATNPEGSLTFQFHSDQGVTGTGWSALLSCFGDNSINISDDLHFCNVFPNPSRGIFQIYSDENIKSISITDLIGKNIPFHEKTENSKSTIQISDIKSGIYFIHISTNQNVYLQQIEIIN